MCCPRGNICEGWGDAQVKMPDETDCPYEDPEPPVTVLPLCTEATDPRPTRRLLLLGPGNRGGHFRLEKWQSRGQARRAALFDRDSRVSDC